MRTRTFELSFPSILQDKIVTLNDFGFKTQISHGLYDLWIAKKVNGGILCYAKQLSREKPSKKEVQTFFDELENIASLEHPNIFPIIGVTNTFPLTAFTQIEENRTLHNFISDNDLDIAFDGTRSTITALLISEALSYIHSNGYSMHHLSTQSIFMNKEYLPILSLIESNSIDPPPWKPPEVYKGHSRDEKSDVFLFAFVLFEMLTGSVPFQGVSQAESDKSICVKKMRPTIPNSTPEKLKLLIKHCWSPKRINRPTFNDITNLFLSGTVAFPESNHKDVLNFVKTQKHLKKKKPSENEFDLYMTVTRQMKTSQAPTTNQQISNKRKWDEIVVASSSGTMRSSPPLSIDSSPAINEVNNSTWKPLKIIDALGVEVFDDFASPEFSEALEKIDSLIDTMNIEGFLLKMKAQFQKMLPDPMKEAIVRSISRAIKKKTDFDAISKTNIFQVLPYHEVQLHIPILELIYLIAQNSPNTIPMEAYSILSLCTEKYPDKVLVLMSIILKNSTKLVISDLYVLLLFEKSLFYISSKHSEQYLILLYNVIQHFPFLIQSNGNRIIELYLNVIKSSNSIRAKRISYNSLCCLYPDDSPIPIEIIMKDFENFDINDCVLHSLKQKQNIPITPSFISNLVKLAQNDSEALYILIRLAKNPTTSQVLLSFPEWLEYDLPSFEGTFRLFLVVFSHQTLRSRVIAMKNFPLFMNKIVSSNNPDIVMALDLLTMRIPINRPMISLISSSGFFASLFEKLEKENSDSLVMSLLNVLTRLSKLGYSPEFSKYIDVHQKLLTSGTIIAKATFSLLYGLSLYKECAKAFNERGVGDMVEQILKDKVQASTISIFLSRIKM